MATVTFVKDANKLAYDDFNSPRIAQRLNEELSKLKVFPVYRSTNDKSPQVYLVSEAWYQAALAAFVGVPPAIKFTTITDDHLGTTFSRYVNLCLGRTEVKSETRLVVAQGPTQSTYQGFTVINTKTYDLVDNKGSSATVGEIAKGNVIRARLLAPAYYTAIAP